MQATFMIDDGHGGNLIIRNLTPFVVDNEWEAAMAGILTAEEIRQQLEHNIVNEFLNTVRPGFMEHFTNQAINDMNDPQAGPPPELPKLTLGEFSDIPSRRYHKTDKDENYKQECCTICMANFVSNNKIPQLACGHDFHWKCLERWATKHHKICPICKEELRGPSD